MSINKLVKIGSISIGVLMANLSYADTLNSDNEKEIDFSDPTVVYSSVELAYGSEGSTLGLGFATSLNDNWGALAKYEAKEDLQLHRLRVASTSTEQGTGFMLDYIWDTDFANADAHSLVFNGLQVLPLGDKAIFVPMVGAGFTSNDFSENRAYIGMAQAMVVYNFTSEVWINLIPQYSYGFNALEMKNAPDINIRKFEFESVLGYRFKGNQNVRLMYKYNEDKDHEGTISYTYAF